MKIYNNEKKGLFICLGKCKIIESKEESMVMVHIENLEILIVTKDVFKNKFKEIKNLKFDV